MSLMNFREPNQVKWVGVRLAHNGTKILKRAYADDNITVIHTVASGKTLYLVSWGLFIYKNVTGRYYLGLRNSSGIDYYILGLGYHYAGNPAIPCVGYSYPPIEVPAGHHIIVLSGAPGLEAWGNIYGWEE